MKLGKKKLQELKDKKISIEDLNEKHLYTIKDGVIGVNTGNTLLLLNENICSFQKLVNKFNSDSRLSTLLWNKELFEELFKNNRLNTDDLKYLLNTIDKGYELCWLCKNTSLIKKILNEFILDRGNVDRFNRIIENEWCKTHNIHTIFEFIEYENKNNEELLKLNELNKYTCALDFSKIQKLGLVEILKNSEKAKEILKQLIDNHLEDQYDFEALKELLTKDNAKKLKTKFNL